MGLKDCALYYLYPFWGRKDRASGHIERLCWQMGVGFCGKVPRIRAGYAYLARFEPECVLLMGDGRRIIRQNPYLAAASEVAGSALERAVGRLINRAKGMLTV
jgi:hypothetical protein